MDQNLENQNFSAQSSDAAASSGKQPKWHSGRLSLLLAALTCAGILLLGLYLLQALRGGTLSGSHIRLLLRAAWVCAGVSAICILLALVTFFARWKHKGSAAAGLLLSLVILGGSVGGLTIYSYVFGGMNHDAEHNDLSDEDLFAAGQKEDGEIIRSTIPTGGTMPEEMTVPTEPNGEKMEWIEYTYEDIPEEARAYLDSEPPAHPSYLLEGADQISTYMIFGLDNNRSSDAMILLAVDRPHKKLKMISFARDTYACYPMWGPDGYTRLAYPYTYGGATGELMTINHNFSLSVQDYVSADFGQLEDIIDYVGGVDVELSYAEYCYLANRYYGLSTGACHLNGEQALTYARMRKESDIKDYFDGEVKRTGRQRAVITAIMESIRNMPVTEFPAFVRTCLGMCTTSLDQNEILDLALEVVQGDYSIESYALVNEVDHWQGSFGPNNYYYYVYDFNRASDWIYRTVYEEYYISGYEDPAAPTE